MTKEKDALSFGIVGLIAYLKEVHTCIMYCIGKGAYTMVDLSNGEKAHISSNLGVLESAFINNSLLRNDRNMLVNIRFIAEVDFKHFSITLKNGLVFDLSDIARRLLTKCKKQNIFKLNFRLIKKSELLIDKFKYVPLVRRVLWIYGEEKRKINRGTYN